jgi:hypothetical protein
MKSKKAATGNETNLLLPFLSRAADLPGTKKGSGVPGTLKFRFPGTKRGHSVPGNR